MNPNDPMQFGQDISSFKAFLNQLIDLLVSELFPPDLRNSLSVFRIDNVESGVFHGLHHSSLVDPSFVEEGLP